MNNSGNERIRQRCIFLGKLLHSLTPNPFIMKFLNDPNRIPQSYGFRIALGLIAYFLVMHLAGLAHEVELRLLNLLILVTGVYLALRKFRETLRGGPRVPLRSRRVTTDCRANLRPGRTMEIAPKCRVHCGRIYTRRSW